MTLLLTDRGPFRWLIWPEVGEADAFSITLTGLSTDSLGNYGAVGDHASIGYTIDPDNATETVKWSNSSDPDDSATYGTGAAPTDFTASDGSTVYLHVTDGGETVTRSFAVRKGPVTVADALGPYSWTVDDDDISVDATSDFTLNGNTAASWVVTGLPDGGVDDSDGSWSGTADPVAGDPMTGDSGTITVILTDGYGRVYTSEANWTSSLRTQATGGTDLDLAYEEGTPTVNQDLTANWTDNGNTLGSAQVSPAVPTNMAVSSAGLLTRTGSLSITADDTYTLTMEDEYGRETSDTFTLEITEAVSSVNPTISDIIFTDNNDGTPADLQVQGGYTGADTLDATLEFYDGASLVATATVLAVTVTSESFDFTEAIEEADLTYEAGFDETDLPNVDSIEVTIEERNNGGSVGPTSEAVSGLSGEPPVITWATNAAGTQIIGTADKAAYLTEDSADWSADGSTTGTLSISGVAGNGTTTITLTLSGGPLVNGETVTLDYTNSDTDLRGPDGNEVANFSGTSVTNNVSGSFVPSDDASLRAHYDASDESSIDDTSGTVTEWRDQTSNNYDLSTIFGNPQTGSRTLNSLNVVEFDGTDDLVRTNSFACGNDLALHWVCELDAVDNNQMAPWGLDQGGTSLYVRANHGSEYRGSISGSGFTDSANGTGNPFSGTLLMSLIIDVTAETITLFIDDTQVAQSTDYTSAAGITGSTRLQMGGLFGGGAAWDGSLAEVCVTDDLTNRADYTAYLADKWGITL